MQEEGPARGRAAAAAAAAAGAGPGELATRWGAGLGRPLLCSPFQFHAAQGPWVPSSRLSLLAQGRRGLLQALSCWEKVSCTMHRAATGPEARCCHCKCTKACEESSLRLLIKHL